MGDRLPMGWECVEIGTVCDLINGKVFKSKDWTESGLPIVRIQNLNNPTAKFNFFEGKIEEKYLIDTGTLLFAWSGTPGTSFGAHIWNHGPAVLNQHIFKVEISKKWLSTPFFRYAINQKLEELIAKAHGGVGLRHVTKGKFEKTEISLPPLNEQHRIIAKIDEFMECSTGMKEALDALLPLLDKYRQSVLASAFRGDLTREWSKQNPEIDPAEELIDSLGVPSLPGFKLYEEGKTFSDLPENWKWAPLVNLLSEGPNNGYSPKSGSDATGSLSFKLSATTKGFFDVSETTVKRLYEKIDNNSRLWLENDDLLIQRANSLEYVGASAIFKGPPKTYIYPDLMMRVRIKHDGLRNYVWRYLNSDIARQYFRANATGTSGNMPKINRKTVNNLPIPIPPEYELHVINQKINHAMTLADGINKIVQDAINKQSSLNRSILAKAFRGELVPQDPRDEPSCALLERIKAERDANQKIRKRNKRTRTKKMVQQKSPTEIVSVVGALKLAGTPLTAQDLLARAGYPSDVSTDLLEQFFLDVREELRNGTISCTRKVNDDIFTLVG